MAGNEYMTVFESTLRDVRAFTLKPRDIAAHVTRCSCCYLKKYCSNFLAGESLVARCTTRIYSCFRYSDGTTPDGDGAGFSIELV